MSMKLQWVIILFGMMLMLDTAATLMVVNTKTADDKSLSV